MNRGKFERMAQELPFGVCCCRVQKDGSYVFAGANDEFYSCVGYGRDFFEKTSGILEQIFVMDERKMIKCWAMLAQKDPGRAYGDVLSISQKDGSVRHVQCKVKCPVLEEGETYLLFSCANVDALVKAQTELFDKMNKEKQERRKLNGLVYELPVGIAVLKGGRRYQLEFVNDEFLRVVGYGAEEMLSGRQELLDCFFPEDIGIFEEAVEQCVSSKATTQFELRVVAADGQIRWQLFFCQLYYYKDAIPYFMLVNWDINERKELEDELNLLDEQYRMIEEVTDEFPFEYDVSQKRFRIPHKYHLNGKATDIKEKYWDMDRILKEIHVDDQKSYKNAVYMAALHEISGSVDYRMNVSPEGEEPVYRWYRTVYRSMLGTNGTIIRIIGRTYDISSDRKIQEQLSEQMRLDPLTRLFNKVATGEAVKEFILQKPSGTQVLFLIDIDNFKRINDTFGHTVGDTVILDIAQIIREQFRSSDIVGRVGGDEFLVFMKNTSLEDAVQKARQLCSQNGKQLVGDDAVISVTLSVGLAVYGVDGDEYKTLFEMADRAMYHTKRNGKNNYSFARKGQMEEGDGRRQREMEETAFSLHQRMDKEFLSFAFSLLSHARDINGSFNVLLEQIGKKYELDLVSVFEYSEERAEMTLTNYWSSFGPVYEKSVLPRVIPEFENANPGEFILLEEGPDEEKIIYENRNTGTKRICRLAGIKFEYAGNHVGGFCLGVKDRQRAFGKMEQITLCELSRVVGVFVSLRNKLRADQKEIKHLQNRDKLTGLYNLEAFKNKTEALMKEAPKNDVYALVHADINHFSYVNENFGQQTGDSILKEFAGMLKTLECVKAACRMYSDYFVMLVHGNEKKQIMDQVVRTNNLFEAQQKVRYPAGGMSLSAGICFIEDDKEHFESVLESANLARKQAKKQKNRSCCVYEEGMRIKRDHEIQITGRFYGALQQGELELFLQPKFELKSKKIYGAEALARWRCRSGELMEPAAFITPLENMGYVVDLDFYILEQLLRVMRKWKRAGKELFVVSTNFSRKNFEDGGEVFLSRLTQMMKRYQIEPEYIEIEVTESVIVENLQSLKECLSKLEALGYRIAIDDFGTGYSSLSVLLEIPADVIKIDKSFTDKIDLQEQRNFVLHMGNFIRAAKEEVIFEGIETEEQSNFLESCGFIYGQGYLFDKPLAVEEFERKYI